MVTLEQQQHVLKRKWASHCLQISIVHHVSLGTFEMDRSSSQIPCVRDKECRRTQSGRTAAASARRSKVRVGSTGFDHLATSDGLGRLQSGLGRSSRIRRSRCLRVGGRRLGGLAAMALLQHGSCSRVVVQEAFQILPQNPRGLQDRIPAADVLDQPRC